MLLPAATPQYLHTSSPSSLSVCLSVASTARMRSHARLSIVHPVPSPGMS